MNTTIIIKGKDSDKVYDRLFAKVASTVLFPRDAVSLHEYATPDGYAVEFQYLDADVIAWCTARPKSFEVR